MTRRSPCATASLLPSLPVLATSPPEHSGCDSGRSRLFVLHDPPAVPLGIHPPMVRSFRTTARIVSWLTPNSAARERRLLVAARARMAPLAHGSACEHGRDTEGVKIHHAPMATADGSEGSARRSGNGMREHPSGRIEDVEAIPVAFARSPLTLYAFRALGVDLQPTPAPRAREAARPARESLTHPDPGGLGGDERAGERGDPRCGLRSASYADAAICPTSPAKRKARPLSHGWIVYRTRSVDDPERCAAPARPRCLRSRSVPATFRSIRWLSKTDRRSLCRLH